MKKILFVLLALACVDTASAQDFTLFMASTEKGIEPFLWGSIKVGGIWIDARYNHFEKTLETFIGKSTPFQITPLKIIPAIGILFGHYAGFSFECYVDNKYVTGLNQVSVTRKGRWLYHLTDLHLLKKKSLDIGIGEQFIWIFNESRQLKVGPFVKARWGRFCCKVRLWKPTQWAGNLLGLEFSW
ncbi:MAG: hypothetical protein WC659_02210 [Patescibacteria group bacterium]